MPAPTASVVIPSYARPERLRACLLALADTRFDAPFEVVVVDDGSTDDSAAIAQGYEDVLVVRGPARGIGAARNRAIAAGSGEFIAPLDADDLWEPTKIERQLAALSEAVARRYFLQGAEPLRAGGLTLA